MVKMLSADTHGWYFKEGLLMVSAIAKVGVLFRGMVLKFPLRISS